MPAKNTVFAYGAQLFAIIFPILTIPILISELGAYDYSIWVIFQTTLSYLMLANFGLGNTFLRLVSSSDGGDKNIIYSTYFYLFFKISIVIALLILIGSLFSNEVGSHVNINLVINGFLIFIFNFLGVICFNNLFGMNKLYAASGIEIGKWFLLTLGVYIYSMQANITLVGLSYLYVVISAVYFSMLFILNNFIVNMLPRYREVNFRLVKQGFKDSSSYFLLALASMIVFNSDNFIVASTISVATVAAYSITYKLVDVSQKFVWKYSDICFPSLAAEYSNGDRSVFHKKLIRIGFIQILLTFISLLMIFLTADTIVHYWLSGAVVIDKNLLFVFSLFMMMHTILRVASLGLSSMAKHHGLAKISILEAFLNVLISLLLVEYFGVIGVALGTLIAQLLTTFPYALVSYFKIYKFDNVDIKE